jgi:predicted RNase H-like nuclease (RuvC/YqgF family)
MDGFNLPGWVGPMIGSLFAGIATLGAAILSYRSQAKRIKTEIEHKDRVSDVSEFEAIIRGNKILRDSLLQRIAYCEQVCQENEKYQEQLTLLRRQVNTLQDRLALCERYERQVKYMREQIGLYERQVIDLQERLDKAEGKAE